MVVLERHQNSSILKHAVSIAHAGIRNHLQTDSSDCDDGEVHADRVYERRMDLYKMKRKQRDLMKYQEARGPKLTFCPHAAASSAPPPHLQP